MRLTTKLYKELYEEGYNAACVDIAEMVAIIKQRYLDVLKDPDVHYSPEIERLCGTIINGICKNIIDNLNYK